MVMFLFSMMNNIHIFILQERPVRIEGSVILYSLLHESSKIAIVKSHSFYCFIPLKSRNQDVVMHCEVRSRRYQSNVVKYLGLGDEVSCFVEALFHIESHQYAAGWLHCGLLACVVWKTGLSKGPLAGGGKVVDSPGSLLRCVSSRERLAITGKKLTLSYSEDELSIQVWNS